MSRARHLGSDVLWVRECFAESEHHVHVSVYLVRTPKGWILIDSGSFHHRTEIAETIGDVTNGQGIGAIVLSHSDYPHAGNIPAFRSNWGDFEIVASCAEPEIQGLPYARRTKIGERADVLGKTFLVLDPPLADRSHTTWVFQEESRTLFVADGFGTIHSPGTCDSAWGSLPPGNRSAGVEVFHAQTLPWLKYADPKRVMGALHLMLEEVQPQWIAPIHGPPISEDDIDAYMVDLEAALTRIAAT